MSGYREVDSYTTADGTKYSAIAGSSGTRIIKTDSSGKKTYLASTKKKTSRSTNATRVQNQFASFKEGLEIISNDPDILASPATSFAAVI